MRSTIKWSGREGAGTRARLGNFNRGVRVAHVSAKGARTWGTGGLGKFERLFDGYGFGQVSGLVYVAAAADGDVVGQQLERDDFENGRQFFRGRRNEDDVVGGVFDLFVAFGRQCDDLSGARFDFF